MNNTIGPKGELSYKFKEIYNKQNLFDNVIIEDFEGNCNNTKIT